MGYVFLLLIWGNILPGFLNKNLKYKLGLEGFMHTRLLEADQYKNGQLPHTIQILFIGSSHAYRGFDPRIFAEANLRTFNLGSSNQTPLQTNLLLKQYLVNLKPELIVFEVYPEIFEMDGVESSVDVISNCSSFKFAFLHALSVNHIISYNTLLYSSLRKIFFNDLSFVEDKRIGNDTYVEGGYVEKDAKQKGISVNQKKKNWNLNNTQVFAFKETLTFLKENKVPFLLVQSPITKALYSSYSNNVEIDSFFLSLGSYKNYNEDKELNLSDTIDFYDEHHLNQSGVSKFNLRVIKDFKQNLNVKLF